MSSPAALGPYTNPALTGGEQTTLGTPSAVRAYLSVPPQSSIQVATGTVNTAVFNNDSYIGFTISSPSGFANVVAGQTVLVGTTPGANDAGTFRVRSWNNGTSTLTVGQTALSDTGLFNYESQQVAFNPGNYVTVISQLNLWQAFPRIIVGTPATFYKDYDRAFANDTLSPPGIVNIGAHRSAFVDSGQTYATMSFTVFTFMWPGSTTPWHFTWTLPAGATLVSGSLTSTDSGGDGLHSGAAITVRFPVGCQTITLTSTVTNSNSAPNTTVSTRYIFIHDGTPQKPGPTYPPLPITQCHIDDDGTGVTVEATVLTADYGTIINGTLCNYFEIPTFGNGGTVTGLNTNVTGWITQAKPQTEGGLMSAVVTLHNPGVVMQGINAHSQRIDILATPLDWQHVIPQLCTIEYFIYYMLLYHEPNVLTLFDFYIYWPPSTNDYVAIGLTVNAGSEMQQLQELAKRESYMMIGFDPTGALWLRPHPAMMVTSANSSQIVVRDTLGPDKYSHIDWQYDTFKKCGSVQGEGFAYFGLTDPVTGLPFAQPFLHRAPGTQFGQGLGEQRIESQVVATGSPNFVGARWATGGYYNWLNSPYPVANVAIPYNRDVYQIAQWGVVAVNIPANISPTGSAFNSPGVYWYGNWIPTRKSKTINDNGTVDIQLTLAYQTQGFQATDITPPPPIVSGNLNPPPPPPPPPPPNYGTGCHCYDFTTGLHGWNVYSSAAWPGGIGCNAAGMLGYELFGTGVHSVQLNDGCGTPLVHTIVAIQINLGGAVHLTRLDLKGTFIVPHTGASPETINVYYYDINGALITTDTSSLGGSPFEYVNAGDVLGCASITAWVNTQQTVTDFDGSGNAIFTSAKICTSTIPDPITSGISCS